MINKELEAKIFNDMYLDMMNFASKNRNKVGYVRVWFLKDEKKNWMEFIEAKKINKKVERPFEKSDFPLYKTPPPKLSEDEFHIDSFIAYFQMMWEYNHTKWGWSQVITLFGMSSDKLFSKLKPKNLDDSD